MMSICGDSDKKDKKTDQFSFSIFKAHRKPTSAKKHKGPGGNLRNIIPISRNCLPLIKRTDIAGSRVVVAFGQIKICDSAW